MDYRDLDLKKAFGPYASLLAFGFPLATVSVYFYLTLFDDHDFVRRFGIKGLSFDTCVDASYWIANSIYIAHTVLFVFVFFCFISSLYFSYKLDAMLFIGVLILGSIFIFPFVVMLLSDKVFIIPSLLKSSCDIAGASVFYALVVLINMMSAYVVSGTAYFLFGVYKDRAGRG